MTARVTDIRSIAYAMPDIEAERAFYTQCWGLRQIAEADGMVYLATFGHDEAYVVRLRQAADKRVDVISFAAETRADVDALHDKVVAAGCRVVHPPRALTGFGGGYGFRFFSPDGLPLEVSAEVARGDHRTMERWEGLPERIGHIVLHSPDHKALVAFFVEALGFKVSDWLGDYMGFLRCSDAHHRLAVLPGPPCLNHVAYDMPTVDDMMRGVQRLKTQGTDIRWGPGRHTAGNNTFSYFTTPADFAVEYTSELEMVDFETHQPTVHKPGPHTMDQWGIGVGSPQTMPQPTPDPGLFQPAEA